MLYHTDISTKVNNAHILGPKSQKSGLGLVRVVQI